MGREIRRVKPGWEHPRQDDGQYKPLHDYDYETHIAEWIAAHQAWIEGRHEAQSPRSWSYDSEAPRWYQEYAGAPNDPDECRPKWTPEEATAWQLYENVSEGTPLTPVFATAEELIEWLCAKGDSWGKGRPYSRVAAESVVRDGSLPSMIVANGRILTPEDMDL